MEKNDVSQSAICYSDIIKTAEAFLQSAKKPLHFKIVIDHIMKDLKIDPKTSLCYGNIHYALSSDRRFVSRTIKRKTMWALRDWFSGKDLRVIQNKNVIKTDDEVEDDEDAALLVGNNAFDLDEEIDEETKLAKSAK